MKNELWERAAEVFESSLECAPGPQRAALLDAACGGDEALRREVESLISAHEEARSFMEDAPLRLPLARVMQDAPQLVGQRVGPYRLVREVGRGGMGAVYAAERDDAEFERSVAIKVIKRGMDSEAILRRFFRERQILARLEHPNIARLLDGGTTGDGLPYFVMEYIEGEPIDLYCERRRLSTNERLELFRTVCAAVSYAHQNLVVHRDLKPPNILVTADGVPKLLDFGIAKLLNPDLYPQAVEPTATALRLMTPDYASPEQVRGAPVTTASDIYSLGVLLYELLTGRRPYRTENCTPREIERLVCEQEPARPSTAADLRETASATEAAPAGARGGRPGRRHRRLSGDLDNIVLMALRKEPHRRYSSVEQFAEDIRRHLKQLPVIARQDTFGYRASKFVRRHRVGVGAAAVFLLLLATASGVVFMQSARIARERDKARLERDRAEQVSEFLINLFKVSEPSEAKGNSVTAREILDKGVARVGQDLKGQPEVRAALLDTMGRVYESLGLYPSALPMLEEALRTRRDIFGGEHPDVAESLIHLAAAQRARADFSAAESSLRAALVIRRKLHDGAHPDVAQALSQLASLLILKRDYDAAEPVAREALAMRRSLYGDEHPAVAASLTDLALSRHYKGEHEAAEALYREALALNRKVLGAEHPETAKSLFDLAWLLMDKRAFDESEALHREALDIRVRLYGDAHPDSVRSLYYLGVVFYVKGDYQPAEPIFRRALALQRKLYGDEHPLVARTLNILSATSGYLGKEADGRRLIEEAAAIRRKVLGEEHPDTVMTEANMVWGVYDSGHRAAAERMSRRLLQIQRKNQRDGEPLTGWILIQLGFMLTERGDAAGAEPLLREALALLENSQDKSFWMVANGRSILGGCLTALRRYEEAEPLLVESYPIIKAGAGERNKSTEQARRRLVKLYQAMGRPDKLAQLPK